MLLDVIPSSCFFFSDFCYCEFLAHEEKIPLSYLLIIFPSFLFLTKVTDLSKRKKVQTENRCHSSQKLHPLHFIKKIKNPKLFATTYIHIYIYIS